jgi:hypothetical protein
MSDLLEWRTVGFSKEWKKTVERWITKSWQDGLLLSQATTQ